MSFLPEGQMTQERLYDLNELTSACQSGKILCARAYLFDANRQLHFHLGCCEGVIPFEESALEAAEGAVRDIAIITRVGKITCFTVQAMQTDETGRTTAILSRANAQRQCKEKYFDRLNPGDIVPACVTSIESFGAFCDIGCGLIALLPIDYLSVSRIRTPRERLTLGQNIYCVIKKRDEYGRLVLSMKELLGTWDENIADFSTGETVIGRVRGIESYGIFVEIAPNLAGLAEMREDLEVGDCVSAYIKSILPEKMKIKLIVLNRIEAQLPVPALQFRMTQGHMDYWDYASAQCERHMESFFEG